MICYSYTVIIPYSMYVALLLYFICVAWMSTDHFVFVPKIFMVVSSLLLPLMLSAIVWVCERMGNEVLASFFSLCIILPTTIFDGYTEEDRGREKERVSSSNDKMRIQSVAKIRLSLPKPIRMKSAKFVFVHKCVELYILYLYEACHC